MTLKFITRVYKKTRTEEYPMFEGGSFFSIDCVENYELIRELCSFGAELVVLSPKEISQEITSRVKKMYDRYKKLS